MPSRKHVLSRRGQYEWVPASNGRRAPIVLHLSPRVMAHLAWFGLIWAPTLASSLLFEFRPRMMCLFATRFFATESFPPYARLRTHVFVCNCRDGVAPTLTSSPE